MIKIIFFDIDGTLRDFTQKGISPDTYKAIELARQAGIRCFVATGRHLLEIREEQLLGDLTFDGYVLLNGNYCMDSSFCALYQNPIPISQVRKALELERELGFALLFMERDAMYISRITPMVEKLQADIGTALPPVEPRMERGLIHPIYQMVPYGDDEILARVASSLPLCDSTRWHAGGAFDITAKGGDKRLGIRKVLEHYGFAREECAAIGDGYNDIPMLRYAGVGIAMGNGSDEVKAAADYVTAPIDRNGLLHGVEYLLTL